MQDARGTPLKHRLFAVAGGVLVADLLTKLWVVHGLDGGTVRLLGGRLLLRETRNSGAAFSIGTGATFLLSLLAIGIVAAIVRSAGRLRSPAWAVGLGLVLGGALGNLVDRLLRSPAPLRGAVVDWLDLGWWPVFNVADAAIVVGGALVVLVSWRRGDTEE